MKNILGNSCFADPWNGWGTMFVFFYLQIELETDRNTLGFYGQIAEIRYCLSWNFQMLLVLRRGNLLYVLRTLASYDIIKFISSKLIFSGSFSKNIWHLMVISSHTHWRAFLFSGNKNASTKYFLIHGVFQLNIRFRW